VWTGEYRANSLGWNLQTPGAALAYALEKPTVAHGKERSSVTDSLKIRHEKHKINAGK